MEPKHGAAIPAASCWITSMVRATATPSHKNPVVQRSADNFVCVSRSSMPWPLPLDSCPSQTCTVCPLLQSLYTLSLMHTLHTIVSPHVLVCKCFNHGSLSFEHGLRLWQLPRWAAYPNCDIAQTAPSLWLAVMPCLLQVEVEQEQLWVLLCSPLKV